MNQEHVTNYQLFSMVVLFVIGSSLIVEVAVQVEIDKWIAILIALAATVPTLMVYIKLLFLFPGKNLFDILFLVFGKWVGRLFVLLYTWYAFHLGAMVLRNFDEFVNMIAMPETPMIMPILLMGVFCIRIVKEGIGVLGRSAFFLLPIIVTIISIVQLLCIPQLNLRSLTPILADGWEPVLEGAFSTFSFPFAETVLFAAVLCCPVNKKAPCKPFLGGLIADVFIILTVTFRNLMVMGATLKQSPYFPSCIAVGRIRTGDFLQRMEITASIIFVVGAFTKISICLLAVSIGVKKLVGLDRFRSVVMSISILMILLANGIYKNTMEMVKWAFDIYPYHALPFQLFILLVLLGIALISKHKKKKASEQPSS